MQKAKNLVLLAVFAVCSFILTGAVVNASASASSFQLVCTPDNVAAGATTKCYLVGQIENDPANGNGLYGVVTHNSFHNMSLVKSTSLIKDVVAEDLKNGQKTEFAVTTAAEGLDGTALINFECKNEQGCTILHSPGPVGLIKKGASASITSGEFDASNYTAVAEYTVKLADDATTRECGSMCVDVYYALTANQYGQDDVTSDLKLGVSSKDVCDEVKPTGQGNPSNTGSFASYIALAAGAFIAVSAIVVAKKNNKFSRI